MKKMLESNKSMSLIEIQSSHNYLTKNHQHLPIHKATFVGSVKSLNREGLKKKIN